MKTTFPRWLLSTTFPLCLILLCHCMQAQDTLRLSLKEAEERFLKSNFLLLAKTYDINVAEALAEQAKLWDNPNFQFEFNAYNPNNQSFFPLRNTSSDPNNPTGGAYMFQIQQMINLGQRRSKYVKLSQTNTEIQKASFKDLMRVLRFQVAQTFGNIYSEQQQLELYNQQKEKLEILLSAFKNQVKLGTIPLFEYTRLEIAYKNLKSDLLNLTNQLIQDQTTLNLLIAEKSGVFIKAMVENKVDNAPIPTKSYLFTLAKDSRPDIELAEKGVLYNQQNLDYQKSLAIPRLMVGVDFERFGSAYPSYWGLQTAMDLPWKNRNQGNIQAAKVSIKQAEVVSLQAHNQVEKEVEAAWEQLISTYKLKDDFNNTFSEDISSLLQNATDSYLKRTIDLLSFMDKIQACRDAQLAIINFKNSYFQAQQQVNFVTNSKIF